MTKRYDPLTVKEMIEFETLTNLSFETVNEIFASTNKTPRLKTLAILGWIHAKRDDKALKFDKYLDETEFSDMIVDAFGPNDEAPENASEEEKEAAEEVKKETTSRGRAQRPKQDSV